MIPAVQRVTFVSQLIQWTISLFGLVLSLSGIAVCSTHRPQGITVVGIYMSSNIYYLLLCLARKELCRQIGLQTSNSDIFAKLSRLEVCKPTHLHHSFL